MGLDLVLVSELKDGTEQELCYGRKTWNIADFFLGICDRRVDDYYFSVTLDDWNEFVETVKDDPNWDSIRFLKLLDKYEDDEESIPSEQFDEIRNFVFNVYEDSPQLGYAWEARAIINWVHNDDIVQKAFQENPDGIKLIVSF